MQNLVANSLQQASQNPPGSPVYANNVSIWQHMSDALHQSLYRVLTLLIAVLPGILAFFVALLVFTVTGVAISWMLRRCLTWLKFDLRVARKSGTDWTPSRSPTEIVARVSFWACVLLGLIIGVSAFDTSYATGTTLPIALLPYLTHAVGAALLLVAGILIARFLARSVLISAVNAQLQYARFLSLGREVAGARADCGDGAGPSGGGRKYRRAGLRHSLRRHCSYALSRRRAGLTRTGQPLS